MSEKKKKPRVGVLVLEGHTTRLKDTPGALAAAIELPNGIIVELSWNESWGAAQIRARSGCLSIQPMYSNSVLVTAQEDS